MKVLKSLGLAIAPALLLVAPVLAQATDPLSGSVATISTSWTAIATLGAVVLGGLTVATYIQSIRKKAR